jgi:hypothetical protein
MQLTIRKLRSDNKRLYNLNKSSNDLSTETVIFTSTNDANRSNMQDESINTDPIEEMQQHNEPEVPPPIMIQSVGRAESLGRSFSPKRSLSLPTSAHLQRYPLRTSTPKRTSATPPKKLKKSKVCAAFIEQLMHI